MFSTSLPENNVTISSPLLCEQITLLSLLFKGLFVDMHKVEAPVGHEYPNMWLQHSQVWPTYCKLSVTQGATSCAIHKLSKGYTIHGLHVHSAQSTDSFFEQRNLQLSRSTHTVVHNIYIPLPLCACTTKIVILYPLQWNRWFANSDVHFRV